MLQSAVAAPTIQMGMHFVTRERIHVDRTATAWAIRRFIDPSASFEFIPRTRDIRKLIGIPFDVRGAELSHREGGCTFESLLEKYELRDPALRRMAAIIRGADLPHEDATPPSRRACWRYSTAFATRQQPTSRGSSAAA